MSDKQIKILINALNQSEKRIWYIPIRKKTTINYNNTVLNKVAFDGQQLEFSYWGFNNRPLNKKNFDAMGIGDYVCFICRDTEGYEILDSIVTLEEKYSNSDESSRNWNDKQYELIIKFDSVFVLEKKLKLAKGGNKLDNILEGVHEEVFHNGYYMFRQWNLNKRLPHTKLVQKLIEEDELITKIKKYSLSNNVDNAFSDQRIMGSHGSLHKNDTKNANKEIENFVNMFNGSTFETIEAIDIETRYRNLRDGKKSLGTRSRSPNGEETSLSKKNQKVIGLTGESLVYHLISNGNEKLLKALGIESNKEIIEIKWSNFGYEVGDENFQDKSFGYDIRIDTKVKSVKLEVKTSFGNSGFYSITRNEIKEMARWKEDYFIVKVNYIHRLINGGILEIVLENFPIFNILENLNRVKSMDIYL